MPFVFGAAAILPNISAATVAHATAAPPLTFAVPAVTDPIHTYGEPDLALDGAGRTFVSGPSGTGTQRSIWSGSVDGGLTYRTVTQQPVAPNGLVGTNSPPAGGDTEIVFDQKDGMYFSDLYALACFRVEASQDHGASTSESAFPGGCAGNQPTADRQWQVVYDPPKGVVSTSAYTGAKPLIYLTYNGGGALWTKSTDGTTYTSADGSSVSGTNPHFGNDGSPTIDQVTGKVFEAAASGTTVQMNIGTPDALGNLKFLDDPNGGGLITIATGVLGTAEAHFPVLTMDGARNLYASWTVQDDAVNPAHDQVWVTAAAPPWTTDKWIKPFQVSDGLVATGDAVNSFSWSASGGTNGIADVAWYGGNKNEDPNNVDGQTWNLFMNQVQFQHDANGLVTGPPVSISNGPVVASPHPMHYNDICGAGTGCIIQQGNRNLADFFKVQVDSTGAAEIVYDDTSNGLLQVGAPPSAQAADHAGAPVVTVIRQNGGMGVFGTPVNNTTSRPGGTANWVSAAPTDHLQGGAGDALFPVIGGTNVPDMDMRSSSMSIAGSVLTVKMQVGDLTDPTTPSKLNGASVLEYVTRWQMATPADTQHPWTMFYAEMTGNSTAQTFAAGPAQSSDLCSVSACFPHVILYPESAAAAPGSPVNGAGETGSVSCPGGGVPCTITINVNTADIGNPTASSVLQEVGAYSLASSHLQATQTMAQSQADNVPIEVDGVCCYNFQGAPAPVLPEFPTPLLPVTAAAVALLVASTLRVRAARRRAGARAVS